MRDSSSAGSFAAAVSRALRTQGFRPLPSGSTRMREGIRVSKFRADTASVSVDLDAPGTARRMADDVAEALTDAGYAVKRNTELSTIMQVSRRAEPPAPVTVSVNELAVALGQLDGTLTSRTHREQATMILEQVVAIQAETNALINGALTEAAQRTPGVHVITEDDRKDR